MQGLTLFNLNLTHLLDAFLETAVPMIAGLAEVVGLFIIITSLAKATFYYVRATFFNDHRAFHHEMAGPFPPFSIGKFGHAVDALRLGVRNDFGFYRHTR